MNDIRFTPSAVTADIIAEFWMLGEVPRLTDRQGEEIHRHAIKAIEWLGDQVSWRQSGGVRDAVDTIALAWMVQQFGDPNDLQQSSGQLIAPSHISRYCAFARWRDLRSAVKAEFRSRRAR